MLKYYLIVTVSGEGFHIDLQVPSIGNMKWAERLAEMYLREGYRHREPDGWVYYPPHVIQTITIKLGDKIRCALG